MMTIYILMSLHILNSLNSFALNYASFYLFIYLFILLPFFFFLNCAKHMMTLYILMTLHILNSLNSFALNYALLLLLKSFFLKKRIPQLSIEYFPIFHLTLFFLVSLSIMTELTTTDLPSPITLVNPIS